MGVSADMRLLMSHTRMVRSSELEMMSSCFGWKSTHDTLFVWPRIVSTSHALVSFMRHSLIWRSSAPLTMSGSVGWKAAQFTPRSWPSSTYLTTASLPPKRSLLRREEMVPSSAEGTPRTVFLRSPAVSHTRMVWSSDALMMRSSRGWKHAHIT